MGCGRSVGGVDLLAAIMTKDPKWPLWLVFCLVALAIAVLIIGKAHAHDHSRPELNDWYKSLNSGKGPCCDGSDFGNGTAVTLDDPDWESRDGHYRVRIEGEWTDVDDSAVLNIPNRDGRAIVWFYHLNGHPAARCFIPGAGT